MGEASALALMALGHSSPEQRAEAEPDLFEFHHGDYADLLSNYVRLRGGAANLEFQMRHARGEDNLAHAWTVAQEVLPALEDGTLEVDPATALRLLDECFIAAWSEAGRDVARDVAERFWELVEAEPGARDVFLLHEVRMRGNLDLVGLR